VTAVRFERRADGTTAVTFNYDEVIVSTIKLVVPSFLRSWNRVCREWLILEPVYASELARVLRGAGYTVIGDMGGKPPPTRCHCESDSNHWARALFARVGPDRAPLAYKVLSKVCHPDHGGDHQLQLEAECGVRRITAQRKEISLMSSYGNHVYTTERAAAARKLVELAVACNDDGFAEAMHAIAGIHAGWPFGPNGAELTVNTAELDIWNLLAVTALLAEELARYACDDEDEDESTTDRDWTLERCIDCDTLVTPDTPMGSRDWQMYFVHQQVWADAGMDGFSAGWLCIPCLEARLGRPLTGADLTAAPINEPGRYDDTERLAHLKREAADMVNKAAR
jgi:hypothetical protein